MGLFARWNGAFPSVVWADKKSTTSASSPTHTFTSVGISLGSPTRDVFIVTSDAVASAVKVVTASIPLGVSATPVESAVAGAVKLWRASVPSTDTTASVEVTASGSTRILIEVWAAYNISDTTPFHTASYTSAGSATTHTTTINRPTAGILIAGAGATVNPTETLSSWTGATVDDNTNVSAGAVRLIISGASTENTTAATGATLRTTWSASVNAGMVAATYL